MNFQARIAKVEAERRLPDNVVPFRIRPERREPQKWWEKAQVGQLVSKDFTGDAA